MLRTEYRTLDRPVQAELESALVEAKEALEGDSNDAEHDALLGLYELLSDARLEYED